jgi:hypothetical protein
MSGWQQLANGHVKISKSRRSMREKKGGTEIDTLFWRKVNNAYLVQPVSTKKESSEQRMINAQFSGSCLGLRNEDCLDRRMQIA